MKKLVKGILEFRKTILPHYRETFAKLALGQKPDALYIGCSDSRVAVNLFASTDPGDLFVNRNVGNMIPPYKENFPQTNGVSAAIEFSILTLNVKNIIVCGHSECGAMLALTGGLDKVHSAPLREWLEYGLESLKDFESKIEFASNLTPHNRLSQVNVLKQIDHLKSYPAVQERLMKGEIAIHGWWFEIARGEVYSFNESKKSFVLIDETEGAEILRKLELHDKPTKNTK